MMNIIGNYDEDEPFHVNLEEYVGDMPFFVDENGKSVERNKFNYPYNYSEYVLWRSGYHEKANCTIYSDRLLSQDRTKHDDLCKKHFGDKGQYWDHRNRSLIEKFLQDFHGDDKMVIVSIHEACNVSNGYPYWRFNVYKQD